MKTIELYSKKYKVPQSWSEVTLRQQMKVTADSEKITIEELKKFAILSGYANIPIDILKQAHISDLQGLFEAISFINEPLPEKPIIEFDFNGKHYYCGQNMVDMEFQDFISIENTIQQFSGNTYNALPTILAIMCKQKKSDGILESISDYDVIKRAEEFQDLPLPIAHQLSLFFYHSETLYSKLIPQFSNKETMDQIMAMQIASTENTLKELAGQGLLHRCASGILRWYLRYIKRELKKHSTSIQ